MQLTSGETEVKKSGDFNFQAMGNCSCRKNDDVIDSGIKPKTMTSSLMDKLSTIDDVIVHKINSTTPPYPNRLRRLANCALDRLRP